MVRSVHTFFCELETPLTRTEEGKLRCESALEAICSQLICHLDALIWHTRLVGTAPENISPRPSPRGIRVSDGGKLQESGCWDGM